MATQDEARRYLAAVLADAGADMATASRAVGRNHAYIYQYINKGKPRWLPEPVREGLAQLYPIDTEKLKAPPAKLRPPSHRKRSVRNGDHKRNIDTQSNDQLMDDPRTLELLGVWGAVPPDRRDLALQILRSLANTARSVAL